MSGDDGLEILRIPSSPYPGLRPFLYHEAALFLGREQQVKEVVARLKETQFVAVIGGSGSGKSSLVRAGVVPNLRGFGIPDAGDYWVPVVFTPGTTAKNKSDVVRSDDKFTINETPITRLAGKFSQQLGSLMLGNDPTTVDAGKESARRLDISDMFSRGSGFARLIDAYSAELPAIGPKRENARFLFIIDQFEELFHPNNKGNHDTRVLIEAVIDHFFSPHLRCFVILTMRSEQLADCAGYLELPDAINKSVYLVRRPDKVELREAITGPAREFLRILQRGDDAAKLPDEIAFDEAVVKRLLQDVEQIAGDSDHLPLLQHLLARIWQVANKRCGVDGEYGVPNDVKWCDLEEASDPAHNEAGWLRRLDADRKSGEAPFNTLRVSLEKWAQVTYEAKACDKKHIDVVLRRLAFKDPNNGTYNQQRLDVNDPTLFAGDVARPNSLKELVEDGYLDTVHYLYWDKENPARVTLKVSHESFIRGWRHFRGLIDDEADRFEVFLTVLRRCSEWRDDKQNPERLLGPAELLRIDEAKLRSVFSKRDQRDGWFGTLKQYRDGDRLSNVEAEVAAHYIESSHARLDAQAAEKLAQEEDKRKAQENARLAAEQARNAKEEVRLAGEREKEAEARRKAEEIAHKLSLQAEADAKRIAEQRAQHAEEEARLAAQRDNEEKQRIQAEAAKAKATSKRNKAYAIALSIGLFVATPYLMTSCVMEAGENLAKARWMAETRTYGLEEPNSRYAGRELDFLLLASSEVADGQAKGEYINQRPMTWISKFPQISRAQRFFYLQNADAAINGYLRARLTSGIWRSVQQPPENKDYDPDNPTICKSDLGRGVLYPDRDTSRGIFVPERKSGGDIYLYAATYSRNASGQEASCTLSPTSIWREASFFDPVILLDAHDRYMAISRSGVFVPRPSVNLHRIVWDDDPKVPGARVDQIGQVIGDDVVSVLAKEIEAKPKQPSADSRVKSVRTWPEYGGIGVAVDGMSWRLFDDEARELKVSDKDKWLDLVDASEGDSKCKILEQVLRKGRVLTPTFTVTTWSDGSHCFVIQQPLKPPVATIEEHVPPTDGVKLAKSANPDLPKKIVVGVYNALIPIELEDFMPVAITAIQQFASPQAAEGAKWVVGLSGNYAGWIALRNNCDGEGNHCHYLGAPWSTVALAGLGKEVVAASCDPLTKVPQAPPKTSDKPYKLQCATGNDQISKANRP